MSTVPSKGETSLSSAIYAKLNLTFQTYMVKNNKKNKKYLSDVKLFFKQINQSSINLQHKKDSVEITTAPVNMIMSFKTGFNDLIFP